MLPCLVLLLLFIYSLDRLDETCPELGRRIRLTLPAIRYTQYDIRIHLQLQPAFSSLNDLLLMNEA